MTHEHKVGYILLSVRGFIKNKRKHKSRKAITGQGKAIFKLKKKKKNSIKPKRQLILKEKRLQHNLGVQENFEVYSSVLGSAKYILPNVFPP